MSEEKELKKLKVYDIVPCLEYIKDSHNEIIVLAHGLSGNKNTIVSYYEKFDKFGKGTFSFDFPNHGDRKNNYMAYSVEKCLETISYIYQYLRDKYPDKKISFLCTSMGSLYLYKFLNESKANINKVLFKCMPLNNAIRMKDMFVKENDLDRTFFTINNGIELPKSLFNDLDKLEQSLTEIDHIKKDNILFIHGTDDNIALIDDIHKFCNKYNYNLCEINGADHSFNGIGVEEIYKKTIFDFFSN